MAKIKVGLIGYGYWGPNIARIISESKHLELKYVADLIDESIAQVNKNYPKVITTKDYSEILKDKEINAVFIVTPTKTHFKIASDAMDAGKNIFIEKPLTNNTADAKRLVDKAKNKKIKLAVGHLFLYNPAVKYIKSVIDSNKLGKIRHIHFQRRNLGPIRKDVNSMWDLAPHDISMLLYFINSPIVSVIATGQSFLQKNLEDVVSVSLKFKNGVMANMIFSWIDPVKIRDITVVGDKKMLLFDDVQEKNKIKVFDKNANIIENTRGVSFSEYRIALHEGKVSAPKIENKEPLKEEIEAFAVSLKNNKPLVNDGKNGLEVVKVLELMQKSLDNGSIVVKP